MQIESKPRISTKQTHTNKLSIKCAVHGFVRGCRLYNNEIIHNVHTIPLNLFRHRSSCYRCCCWRLVFFPFFADSIFVKICFQRFGKRSKNFSSHRTIQSYRSYDLIGNLLLYFVFRFSKTISIQTNYFTCTPY